MKKTKALPKSEDTKVVVFLMPNKLFLPGDSFCHVFKKTGEMDTPILRGYSLVLKRLKATRSAILCTGDKDGNININGLYCVVEEIIEIDDEVVVRLNVSAKAKVIEVENPPSVRRINILMAKKFSVFKSIFEDVDMLECTTLSLENILRKMINMDIFDPYIGSDVIKSSYVGLREVAQGNKSFQTDEKSIESIRRVVYDVARLYLPNYVNLRFFIEFAKEQYLENEIVMVLEALEYINGRQGLVKKLSERAEKLKEEAPKTAPAGSSAIIVHDKRERFEAIKETLSTEARREIENRLDRLEDNEESIHGQEYQSEERYLDFALSLPHGIFAEENENLKEVMEKLENSHFGLKNAKDAAIDYLSVYKQLGHSKGGVMVFYGPAGTGKTSFGQKLAMAMGRPFVKMSLGGVRDEADIRGHRGTYVGALAGRIIQGIRRAGAMNPVFILDEIDKVGADYRGDPNDALMEVLDPDQNHSFRDHYLNFDWDLSSVLFIVTGNEINKIPAILKDRFQDWIKFPGYSREEKVKILRGYMLPEELRSHGLASLELTVNDEVCDYLIRNYSPDPGIRGAQKMVRLLCRKIARQRHFDGICLAKIDLVKPTDIRAYIGKPDIHDSHMGFTAEIEKTGKSEVGPEN